MPFSFTTRSIVSELLTFQFSACCSIGSRRAPFMAGNNPDATPVPNETSSAMMNGSDRLAGIRVALVAIAISQEYECCESGQARSDLLSADDHICSPASGRRQRASLSSAATAPTARPATQRHRDGCCSGAGPSGWVGTFTFRRRDASSELPRYEWRSVRIGPVRAFVKRRGLLRPTPRCRRPTERETQLPTAVRS